MNEPQHDFVCVHFGCVKGCKTFCVDYEVWQVQAGDGFYDDRPWVLCSCKRNYVKAEADCPDCAKDRATDT